MSKEPYYGQLFDAIKELQELVRRQEQLDLHSKALTGIGAPVWEEGSWLKKMRDQNVDEWVRLRDAVVFQHKKIFGIHEALIKDGDDARRESDGQAS